MPQGYRAIEKDQGMSTSGWRDEDKVSAYNAFEMNLELCLKTEITDFPECKRNNTHCRKFEYPYFFLIKKVSVPACRDDLC